MGLVNAVVPLACLEIETVRWCQEMLANSPVTLRCLKAALNADCDGQAGLQVLAGCSHASLVPTQLWRLQSPASLTLSDVLLGGAMIPAEFTTRAEAQVIRSGADMD